MEAGLLVSRNSQDPGEQGSNEPGNWEKFVLLGLESHGVRAVFEATPTGLRNSGRGRMRDRDQNPPHALGTGEPLSSLPSVRCRVGSQLGQGSPCTPSSCCRGVSASGHLHLASVQERILRANLVQNTCGTRVICQWVWTVGGLSPWSLPLLEFTEGFFPFKYF